MEQIRSGHLRTSLSLSRSGSRFATSWRSNRPQEKEEFSRLVKMRPSDRSHSKSSDLRLALFPDCVNLAAASVDVTGSLRDASGARFGNSGAGTSNKLG